MGLDINASRSAAAMYQVRNAGRRPVNANTITVSFKFFDLVELFFKHIDLTGFHQIYNELRMTHQR